MEKKEKIENSVSLSIEVNSLSDDDGVASRGHRANIFKPELLILGSWTSTHGTYGTETVMDYAGGMSTNYFRELEKNYDCATG